MTTVALAGNPNCGKTTLFNQLTGLRQRVGNYPGVTVERRSGRLRTQEGDVDILDLPGTYSLVARSRDESVAFEALTGRNGPPPDAVLLVVDATHLERNLYLALSILELELPTVVALNMMDEVERSGARVDTDALSRALGGVPVVPVSARKGTGLDDLNAAVVQAIHAPRPHAPAPDLAPEHRSALEDLAQILAGGLPEARWLLSSLASTDATPDDEEHPVHGRPDLEAAAEQAHRTLAEHPDLPTALIEARQAQASRIADACWTRGTRADADALSDRVDRWLLHPWIGTAVFTTVMFLLFQGLFAWVDPLVGWIETLVAGTQTVAASILPDGALADLFIDGIVGGVGNVIVFLPQIALLFLVLAVLEDSGYLARAAYLSDRFMAKAGLHGKAFVPLLSGFACAVPAIMATRGIENRKDRLVTILVTPLMSCSARLPVYALLIGALFSRSGSVGPFSVGGLMMFGLYALSAATAVFVAFVLKKTVLASPTPALVLELPTYRLPRVVDVLRRVGDRCWVFMRDAGSIILAISIVMWAMLYFPRAPADAPADAQVAQSVAGHIGRAIEPAIEPLGYDWKIGVGLLASFAAREVFVSTMALVYGVSDAEEDMTPLRERLRAERDADTRRPVYTPLVGLSLLVFFLYAPQCMSTLAIIRRETGGWKWTLFSLGFMGVLAWVAAFAVYQGGRLLGFT